MKNIVLASVCVLLPVMVHASDLPSKSTAPKIAPKQVLKFDGFVGGDLASQSTKSGFLVNGVEVESLDSDGMSYGVHGSLASMLTDQVGLQVDADFRRTTHEFGDCGDGCTLKSNSPSVAGHIYWRESSVGLIGAFAQYTSASQLFAGVSSTEHVFVGLDGQYFINNLTLYAQAAYVNAQLSPEYYVNSDGEGFALTGQARYFAHPDLMIAVRASYINTDWIAEGTELSKNTTATIGGRAEYRLSNNPVSVYGDVSYNMSEVDFSDVAPVKFTMDETRFMFGVNLNFGGASLFERDRSGASLNIIDAPHSPFVGSPS